ncbi:uncharacterized protein [Coffea arabica]|uniref:F-box/LRR-repeat protein 15-like leucin rich repeat domain-containing protein n=1 Tax=Coffea arabica TaxID=13443 RepID=A0A6P6SLM3_COFAR|nr:uncharacterized protein LOC113692560 [Coffea arabica]
MTVLRSREVAPPGMILKTPAKAVDIGVFEPETPAKTLEGLNHQSTTSPLSLSPKAPCQDGKEGLAAGSVHRRSARLASKLDLTEGLETVKTFSRKRKRLDAGNDGSLGDGLNLATASTEKKDDVGIGVGDVMLEEPNKSDSLVDLGNSGQSSDAVESVKQGRRRRKFGIDVELSDLMLVGQDQNENKVLNLRSGRRIVKSGGKKRSGDSSEGVESNDGDKFYTGNDSECMSSGCRGNGGVMYESKVIAEGDGYHSINNVKKFTGEEKSKSKVLEKASFMSGIDLLKLKSEVKEAGGNMVKTEKKVEARSTRRKDKGKEKLVESSSLSKSSCSVGRKSENKLEKENDDTVSSSSLLADSMSSQNAEQTDMSVTADRRVHKVRFREIARRNASRFAHFSSQEEEDNAADTSGGEIPPSDINAETEDWPGPFSTAMKIIRDRQMNANVQRHNSLSDKRGVASVTWKPKKDRQCNLQKQLVPSLQDLCLTILVKNADAITSLDCIPDVLRRRLSQLLCDSRRMGDHFFGLLVQGSPTEIHLRDCSWLSEEIFTRTFEACDTSNLTVLQLDQCGRCLADYVLFGTLARASNCLPALTAASLRAAYRLSDVGLSALVSAAPSLRSINLSQCSLLTSDGIASLAASLGSVLRELYLDDCQGLEAKHILSALLEFEQLEVLSLAGMETVSDDFVSRFVSERGHKIKELVLADCMKLTDSSVRVIVEYCSELCAIDLSNLCNLTDTAIGYLANGCQAIQALKLCRNTFSDEAVAAYLETCGDTLRELSLSNVKQVAQNTAISLARLSRNLQYLDLSWCRNLTNEALGLIVDGCLSLKVLKLFGCTQVTDVFLLGHSNPEVRIIGLKMKPLLEHLEVPDLLRGPLHYSSVSPSL